MFKRLRLWLLSPILTEMYVVFFLERTRHETQVIELKHTIENLEYEVKAQQTERAHLQELFTAAMQRAMSASDDSLSS